MVGTEPNNFDFSDVIAMRLLGIDVGDRRIGLAISDVSATLARPWRTVVRAGSAKKLVTKLAIQIRQLEQGDDGLERIIVGLPKHLDGRAHDQATLVLAFAEMLRDVTKVPITFQDERLTSHEAESRLADSEPDWRKRKLRLDAAAAAVILQDYLDQRLVTEARDLEIEPDLA